MSAPHDPTPSDAMNPATNAERADEAQRQHERLCAYVFGELSGEERASFESELAASPRLQEERERLEATISLVREAIPAEEALSPAARAELSDAASAGSAVPQPAVIHPWPVRVARSPWSVAAASLFLLGGASILALLSEPRPEAVHLGDSVARVERREARVQDAPVAAGVPLTEEEEAEELPPPALATPEAGKGEKEDERRADFAKPAGAYDQRDEQARQAGGRELKATDALGVDPPAESALRGVVGSVDPDDATAGEATGEAVPAIDELLVLEDSAKAQAGFGIEQEEAPGDPGVDDRLIAELQKLGYTGPSDGGGVDSSAKLEAGEVVGSKLAAVSPQDGADGFWLGQGQEQRPQEPQVLRVEVGSPDLALVDPATVEQLRQQGVALKDGSGGLTGGSGGGGSANHLAARKRGKAAPGARAPPGPPGRAPPAPWRRAPRRLRPPGAVEPHRRLPRPPRSPSPRLTSATWPVPRQPRRRRACGATTRAWASCCSRPPRRGAKTGA